MHIPLTSRNLFLGFSLVALFSLVATGNVSAQSFAGGDGTPGNPYEIEDVAQLQAMNDYLSSHFVLVADIDASETRTWNDGAGFEPIGISSFYNPGIDNPFTGSLDGNGKKITNLFINRPERESVGLVGYMEYNGSITGVGLVDVDIRGQYSVGGLVGTNLGTIAMSFVTGTVAGDTDIGGLVGFNDWGGSIANSYATANVTGNQNAGGLVGYSWDGSIETSYAMGYVSGSHSPGGLMGGSYGGSVTSSYWNVSTSEQGEGNGEEFLEGIVGLPDYKFKRQELFVGFDFEVWAIDEGVTYPYLRVNPLPDDTDNSPVGNILYVNQHVAPGGDGSGDNWENAMPELADALRIARERWGDNGSGAGWDETEPLQIWVVGGTYKPLYTAADDAYGSSDGRNNAFVTVPHVQLYGGFDGVEIREGARNWESNKTVLSGDIGLPDNDADNAYHVVVSIGGDNHPIDQHTVLDGFTITGGNADGYGDVMVNGLTVSQHSGGGISIHSASPFLTNLRIDGNSAHEGGGAYLHHSTSLLTGVHIGGNEAEQGGGVYSSSSSPKLTNVHVTDNKALSGGGIYNANSGQSFVLTNVQISGNEADEGGALYNHDASPTLVNVTIAGNTASEAGGIYNHSASVPLIRNSIIWGNGGSNVNGAIGDGSSYNIIEGFAGHNPDIDPLFIDWENGDYTLSKRSPAINAGSGAAYTEVGDNEWDLAGRGRIYNMAAGGLIDIGAFEFHGDYDTGIRYVKSGDDGGTSDGDGLTWATATSDIQRLIDELNGNEGGEIWVMKGTYIMRPPGGPGRGEGIALRNNVALYGGFSGTELARDQRDWENNVTLLSGEGKTRPIYCPNTWDNVLDNTAILDGFTIANGHNVYEFTVYRDLLGNGGAMYLSFASPILRNLIIENNIAQWGGGIYTKNGSPIIENVIIRNNKTTEVEGSGSSGYNGGGIVIQSGSPKLTNVKILGNSADDGSGGGILNLSEDSPELTNVLISGNTAVFGAGMDNFYNAKPILRNVTITGNYASIEGGGMSNSDFDAQDVTIINSIIWGNGPKNFVGPKLHANSGNNLIEGLNGHNTFNGKRFRGSAADIFVDPVAASEGNPTAEGDYQLVSCSPAVNMGNNLAYPGGLDSLVAHNDLAAQPRLAWETVDIGAYEYQGLPAPRLIGPEDGTYRIGDELHFRVNFFKPIGVSGSPSIALIIGGKERTAPFTGITDDGAGALFSYTVVEGDDGADGIGAGAEIALNDDGSIVFEDETELPLSICLPSLSGSLWMVSVQHSRLYRLPQTTKRPLGLR